MATYVLQRLGMALFTLFSISVLAFLIIQLPPGDYVTSYISQLSADGSGVSAGQIQKLRDEYGLDYPVYIQYFFWIGRIVLHGDFGYSMEWGKPVFSVVKDHLLLTVIVAGAGVMLTWL